MCSIAGAKTKQEVDQMLLTQRHRSPDINGVSASDGFYSIGMGRLKVLDLTSENLCPHRRDSLILSYNGEVYNYKELRKELITRGFTFETESDTEVVLAAYKHWGVDCFNKFNGMFAIAIYDGQQIVLARDIAGQKPLFYRTKDFAFASEAKALKNDDTPYRNDTFFNVFQHIHTGTLYENVRQVPPAHYVIKNLNTGKLVVRRYWEFVPRHVNEETALDELHWLVEDAIKLTKQSDVPYGLYRSEGVDSGLLEAYGEYGSIISYTDEDGSKEDFEASINDIVYHLDFPVGSFSSYPLYKLAQRAKKEGLKVVLSGEGADEIFGGYMRYVPVALWSQMLDRYPSYFELFRKTSMPSYVDITKRAPDTDNFLSRHMVPFFNKYDPITAMQVFDFTYILPSLLQMGDRMASAHGIENRCPYLDKRLIEFGLSLPPHLKITTGNTKVLLRQLAKNSMVPMEKEKKGLIAPFNKWYDVPGYNRSIYFNKLKDIWQKQNFVQS